MRKRLAGRIVASVLTVIFAILCVIYAARCRNMENLDAGFRALACGLLSLTSATFYRYFED